MEGAAWYACVVIVLFWRRQQQRRRRQQQQQHEELEAWKRQEQECNDSECDSSTMSLCASRRSLCCDEIGKT